MKKFSFLFVLVGLISISTSFACDLIFVPVTTSCGKQALASGCTTEEIVADAIALDNMLCGPEIAP